MKKNEDRIWDVLLEDAMRDMPAPAPEPAQPYEPGDYTRRLLTPIGPPGVDRGRSMRRTRSRRWASVTATLVAFLFVAGLFYAAVTWLPGLTEDNHADQPQTAGDNNQSPVQPAVSPSNGNDGGQDSPDKPAPKPNAAPENAPKDNAQPEINIEPKPEAGDQPEPQPEEQPEPLPEPKSDDQVEQPKPEPETQPEPKKPVDTVENPSPGDTVEQPDNEPGDHSTAPIKKPLPGREIRLIQSEQGADLLVANADPAGQGDPPYREPSDETEFADCSWFKSKKAVDLVAGDVFFRLDGEVRIEFYSGGGAVLLELTKGKLFADTRGSGKGAYLSFNSTGNSGWLTSGAALIDASSSSVEVKVFDGAISFDDDDAIEHGKQATIRRGKLSTPRDLRTSLEDEPFLAGIENRIVYREDFDSEAPKGRLREGSLQDGVLQGPEVFWGYPENIPYQTGLVVRLRIRLTNCKAATLTLFCNERNDNYSYDLTLSELTPEGWRILEVPASKLLERSNHEGHPLEGESFMNVSLSCEGEGAQVELDWVELIRAVKKHEED